jgi:hypothetical protein
MQLGAGYMMPERSRSCAAANADKAEDREISSKTNLISTSPQTRGVLKDDHLLPPLPTQGLPFLLGLAIFSFLLSFFCLIFLTSSTPLNSLTTLPPLLFPTPSGNPPLLSSFPASIFFLRL